MPRGRERLIADTFVELADTLASDYDVIDFLHLLVERCQEILAVDAAGVLLEDAEGTLTLAVASTEKMERYEQSELAHGQGPCIDAYRGVEQIVAETLHDAHERWPDAVPAALELGLHAVYAFPLRLRDDCIGALNLYREKPGPFDDDDIRLAQAFADVAAIGILQERMAADAAKRGEQLQHALESRIVIEQAKGVVMATAQVTSQQAFEMLRGHARSNRMKLRDLCVEVIESQSADHIGSAPA